jgi:oligopeptide transport system substrate-binding protein
MTATQTKKMTGRGGQALAALLLLGLLFTACGQRETRVEIANRDQILIFGNKSEPQDLDPHVVQGVTEHNLIAALLEGLVAEHPETLMPVPGMAERWDISPDGLVYTFYLRDAKWSNGEPVTASDFIRSYRRILTPTLGSLYSYMLHPIKNAKAFNEGEITDSSQLGLREIDRRTLEITLECPTPYLLNMMAHHYTWWPVHLPTVEKHGDPYRPGNRWTRPENYVGNGPFILAEWVPNSVIRMRKNPDYWDAETVRLNGIDFLPIESVDSEERSFRAGQLHVTYELPNAKIDAYRRNNPELLRMDDYMATYFYRLNMTHPAMQDKRVRHALSQAIDRQAIVETVTRGGQRPAFALTPPDTKGFTPRAQVKFDIEGAKQLLAEAGFPGGRGLPTIEIHYNTSENHRAIAETIQQMWKRNLGIETTLRNEEWKVYLDSQSHTNYVVSRAGWTGDYPDPNTFLDTFLSYSGNNRTGWNNPEFDRLLHEAACTVDEAGRYELFQQAEAILLDDLPVIPLYYYTRVYLLHPAVKNWHPTFLDHHPYKHVYLEPSSE